MSELETGSEASAIAAEGIEEETFSQAQLAWRKYRRHRVAMVSSVILLFIVLAAVFAPLLAPFGETEQNLSNTLESPNGTFWLGTDTLGRDNFSRILYGGRISLLVGVSVALISTFIGTTVGMLAGYFGGWLDATLMRITDIFLSVPFLMLAIMAARILGGSVRDVVLVLSFLGWMTLSRIIRGQVLSLREREFVEAARALGVPSHRIISRHLLPNLVGIITVNGSLAVAGGILAESGLSFLGLGVDPTETATWGNMLGGNEGYMIISPWLVWFPGLAIVLTALCVSYIGDGLRDALDPTQKKV